ncbi:hypothetical protein C8R43DRAFT_1159892 [Mycena crocata]|nr:hypothetical protein C8R43DRAFT_1159892 [Mycena crocata]
MHAMYATFQCLLLLLLVATAHADETADVDLSVECAQNSAVPGAASQAMFVNNNDKSCKCMPAATTDTAWAKCQSPTGGVETGLAICISGVGCSIECFQNAVPRNGDCLPYTIAPSAGMTAVSDQDCKGPKKDPNGVIGAYTDGPCLCKAPYYHKADGGKVCNENIPKNSFATCERSERKVGDSHCSASDASFAKTDAELPYSQFQCEPGFKTSDDFLSCVPATSTTDPGEKGNSSETGETSDLAPKCPDPKVISYSSPSGPCGCESRMALAKKRRPDAVECTPPATNGKVGCKNVGTGSTCSPECDKGFKASPDGKDCVPARANVTISELTCGSDAGGVGFLSADPILGCVCKDTLDPATFCGVAVGDPDAEMMCSDTTDLGGKREVKCAVQCTGSFTSKDKNTCEVVEVEGDSVTLAGTATPRESSETSCKDKVFSLPGKGGCKCAASPPAGATECTAGTNEYAVCLYTKGSGEEADCGTSCVVGKFYKKGVCS